MALKWLLVLPAYTMYCLSGISYCKQNDTAKFMILFMCNLNNYPTVIILSAC